MNCKSCHLSYTNLKPNLPRVLINCGHTLCQSCIEKTIPNQQIQCPQCHSISYGTTLNQYPVNATLILLLKEEAVCKIHNQKLQAYCEKDNQLLCLSCVIGSTHKSHKISSVLQKVAKDRTILRQCMQSIKQSHKQITQAVKMLEEGISQIEGQYKDYLLQIGLCFNNVREKIKQVQQKCTIKAKSQYETILQKWQRSISEMKQKSDFMQQLQQIYQQVMCLPNIQYLHQQNKRLFIVQNCKYKKPKIQFTKLLFNRMIAYNDIQQVVQEMINYQKKIQRISTPKINTKKSSRNKQPTILEVNLNQQYRKHFKSSLDLNHHVATCQGNYQVHLAVHGKQKNNKSSNCNTKNVVSGNNNIVKTPRQCKNFAKKQAISITSSCLSQIEKINMSFHSEALPISMINSFMESSQMSVSIKGSEAAFSMQNYDQRILHIGGFGNNSLQYMKLEDPNGSQLFMTNLQRSRAQCAIIPIYNEYSCIIIGGRCNEERLDTCLQYDIKTNKIYSSSFKISEPKSGFGLAVKDNKVYVAGGSNNHKALKLFEQYQILPNNQFLKQNLPNMNHSRDEVAIVLGFDGYLYACGGINQSASVLSSCQRYNWTKSRWQIIPSMSKSRSSFSLVALPHGIYAIGGYDGHESLKSVELFDFNSEKWINVTAMSSGRFAHTAVVTNDLQYIVVSGGYQNKALKCTEIFDIIKEKWMEGPPLQSQRFLHCSLIVNF